MKKANILYIINKLQVGGAERQLVELLKGLDRVIYSPILICLEKGGEFTEDVKRLDVPIYYFNRKWRWDLLPVLQLVKFIKRYNIHIEHTYLSLASIYGAIAAKLTGIPIVNSSIRKASSFGGYRDFLVKPSLWLSDIIITNSAAGGDYFLKKGNSKLRVIHNGMDLSRFDIKKDKEQKKGELNLDTFDNVITMVAKLEPRKDHVTYLSSAKLILNHFPNTCFLVVGDGILKDNIKRFANQKGVGKNVVFLGNRSDVEEILSITNVSVLTSHADHAEGISNSIIESMAMGLPIIATDSGGTREVVINNKNGFLIPPQNPEILAKRIMQLLQDKELAKEMGKEGKKLVEEKFGLARMVRETEEIYRELLGKYE